MTDKTEMPLVSVAMPSYNSAGFVQAAIESILAQDYPNVQLVISDDASRDGTDKIIKDFALRYPDRIQFQIHAENLGVSKNIESIYPLISGKYVCWFAGDDIFYPHKISRQVALMEEDAACGISFHDIDVIDDRGEFLYRYNDPVLGQQIYESDITSNLIEQRCYFSGLSAMINREKLGDLHHNPDAGACSDWLLIIEASMRTKIRYIPEALGAYRRHESNFTRRISDEPEERIYKYLAKNFPQESSHIGNGLGWLYFNFIFKYALVKDFKNCRIVFEKFVKLALERPHILKFSLLQFFTRFRARLALFLKTGSMIR